MSTPEDIAIPETLDALRQGYRLQQQQLAEQANELAMQRQLLVTREQEIEFLRERLALLLAKRYSHSSETLDSLQLGLFDESELQGEIDRLEAELAAQDNGRDGTGTPHGAKGGQPDAPRPTPKNPPRRRALPAHLRRVNIDIDVSDEQKRRMGDEWIQVGWESSEKLAIQEREAYVKVLRRAKYVRRTESENPLVALEGIKVAPPMPVILPRAIADSSLLAKIVTAKFVDAKSFYREMKSLERDGIELGYSTVCSYPIQLAEQLAPLRPLMLEYAASGALMQLDETTLQVLGEPDRADRTKSYLWALRGGAMDAPVVIFHYHARRNHAALHSWLEPVLDDFHGVIVTDEHKPYQRLADEHDGILARGGCWSHCRRKYADAAKGRRHVSDAHSMLKQIATLYQLEKKTVSLVGDRKVERRRKLLTPQLEKIRSLAEQMVGRYPDKGLMHTALGYTLNNWQSLTAFVDHAALPIDNNRMENAIRPFTVGRRNWLFSGSPGGAEASAFLYSLIESAKANGWEPRAYLNALFERYPYARTEEERRLLLPMFLTKT